MFMSTRYRKKDPEWRKKSLFNVEDSLANLLECLSIEYSVSKLISPKWKNFRSQKLKFESKTRINNAIWRCWHIQYKDAKRPRFFKFDMPFSDQTVHSTPQAVILEGKTWKKRLDIVSREYKKWRKFYNYKILKGGGEETDNLKQQLSTENSEDEFVSDEEEDSYGKKHRQSPTKYAENKPLAPTQKLFESPDFMLDTYLADLPDTLFSSIRPVKSAAENALGLAYTDLSDMIQPTLDQLNPCFDELLQNFDFLTNDWSNLSSNSRAVGPASHSVAPLPAIMDITAEPDGLQQGLINTSTIYNEVLGSNAEYLYSSGVLYAPNPNVAMEKSATGMDSLTTMLTTDSADEGLKFNVARSLNKSDARKRSLTHQNDIVETAPPRKMAIKEVDSRFLNEDYLQKRQPGSTITPMPLAKTDEGKSEYSTRSSNFEALLSNAIDMSSNQNTEQKKSLENIPTEQGPISVESRGISVDTVEEIIAVEGSSQSSQQKMLVNQVATTKVVEFSELPPQLQAPNLTAHLQAVMSARNANPGMPRNKSDTQLSSLADKFASPQSLKTSRKEVSPLVRSKRTHATLSRNMSDTNLVQMAKDTCRVYTRRRLASISVDTKPLMIPRNFSDSNLASLGKAAPRRHQPILPKSLIGIVPPTQSRVAGAITKVAMNQVDAVTAQTSSGGGQFTSFLVNKQQPTNTDPVQVTLYMPKSKKAVQVSAVPKENSVVSTQSSFLPQRVEVIQYKGHGQQTEGNKLIPAATVAPNVSTDASNTNYPIQSVATHRDNLGTNEYSTYVIHKEPANFTVVPSPASHASSTCVANAATGAFVPNSVIQRASRDASSTPNSSHSRDSTGLPAIAIQSSLAADELATVPIAVESSDKANSVAPLEGLSDQQLISLAQILRGSRSGDVKQETTIAYLEMLQKQLNTLLIQQQGKMETSSMNASIKSPNASPLGSNTAVSIAVSNCSSINATAIQNFQSGSNVAGKVSLSSDLDILAKDMKPTCMQSGDKPLNSIQIEEPSPSSSQDIRHYLTLHSSSQAMGSTSSLQGVSTGGVARHLITAHGNQIAQATSSQLFIPRNASTNDAPFARIPDAIHNEASRQVSTIADTCIATSFIQQQQQQLPIPATTHPIVNLVERGAQLATGSATQGMQQPGNIRHPVFIGLQQSDSQTHTIGSSMMDLSIVPSLSTKNTVLMSQATNISNQPVVVAVPHIVSSEIQKTSGTSVRPTMVDLAIAASQRTYLKDESSLLVCSSQGITSVQNANPVTSVHAPSSVTFATQPIQTVALSDISQDKGSENVKRSRLRFQDREMYKEYRRKNHVTAEQKRRGQIKVAFDQMISLIPSLQEDRHGRTSKALVLQKASDYIDHLQREKELTKFKIEKIRQEVNRLNEEIKLCQGKLPACGAVSEQSTARDAKSTYLEHVRQRIMKEPKYWLFSVMLRPLFETFNSSTVTNTLQGFIHSALKWFEDNCSLTVLRPAVIASLRQISTDTAILSNPSALHDQALLAARCHDPTVLGQQPPGSNAELAVGLQQAAPQQATSTLSVAVAQNPVIMTPQPARWAVQSHQQAHNQENTNSKQSFITWSKQLPPS